MNGGGNPQMTLAVASPAVLAGRTDPDTVLALIDTERPTVWITAPRVLQRLLRAPSFDRFDTSSLRLVLVGGAPIPEAAVAEAEERLGARCVSVYGLTETAPFVSAAVPASGVPAAERRAVQATAGLPVLGVETKVVDQDGREVPPDGEAVGEILVRGHAMMQAYHRDPEATRDALAGGWLRTGDLAVVDARGYLTLRGRTRDVIIVGGMHVDAEEIEAALAAHPAVAQCSVVAVSDAEWGEVPIALVVLAPGARVTESDLLAHARQRLAWFKVPRSIRFLETLPTSEAGKVLKSELRTLYAG
jgi:fatty-acyl-CoA synthase